MQSSEGTLTHKARQVPTVLSGRCQPSAYPPVCGSTWGVQTPWLSPFSKLSPGPVCSHRTWINLSLGFWLQTLYLLPSWAGPSSALSSEKYGRTRWWRLVLGHETVQAQPWGWRWLIKPISLSWWWLFLQMSLSTKVRCASVSVHLQGRGVPLFSQAWILSLGPSWGCWSECPLC